MSPNSKINSAQTIADLRAQARRRLPLGIFEFVERGADDDLAIARNRQAFEELLICPKVLVDTSTRSLGIDLFGKPMAAPVAIAPTGAAGLLWYEGEIVAARAAAAAGLPFTLSVSSTTSMEKVADQAKGRLWFQVFMWPDRAMSHELIARAKAAGYEALVVTVDTPVAPVRQYNYRNGFTLPFTVNRRNFADLLLHLPWLATVVGRYFYRSGMPSFENFPREVRHSIRDAPAGRFTLPFSDNLKWEEMRDVRRLWQGPLIIKGIMRPEDAEHAAAIGADGIIISNHGGRNLDSAMPTLQALPEIAERVGDRLAVMIDGGVRRGSDVVKALALGAKAVLVGRALLWGVAAGGEAGAARALKILTEEVDRVLAFMGCPGVAALDRSYLRSAAPVDLLRGARGGPTESLRQVKDASPA